ncbi:MAG: hypothetical protein OEY59_06140 [Deltaproteobacteria bacterium]|nr:hypothetical protein [Deltaproteobacteria bacterium]
MSQQWNQIPERGFLKVNQAALWVFRLVGKKISSFLIWPVLWGYFLTDRQGRKSAGLFLARVHEFTQGQNCLKNKPGIFDSLRLYREFSLQILDRIDFWLDRDRKIKIKWHGDEHLNRLIEQNQGAVFLSAHIGNIDIIRTYAEKNATKNIKVLMFTQNAPQALGIFGKLKLNYHKNLYQINQVTPNTIFELKSMINNGDMLGIMADRITAGSGKRTSRVSFLGKSAAFPQGPFILSGMLECPVFLIFGLKSKTDEYEIHIKPFSDQIQFGEDKTLEITNYIQKYSSQLEAFCCTFPFQWFNFYDFWEENSL